MDSNSLSILTMGYEIFKVFSFVSDSLFIDAFIVRVFGCFTLLAFCCHMTVNILCLFLTVLWVGLQCVIVAFSGHTHFLFVFGPFMSCST